jgi:hypothetical protein
MSTVVSRTIRSTPFRSSSATWTVITELLLQGRSGAARAELHAVAGIAASLITDQAPKDAPIVVTCDGPRTRIYCLYDDEAVEGSDASEDTIGFDPLGGDWAISLPCPKDDLDWVTKALAVHSTRITAREPDAVIAADAATKSAAQSFTLDPKGFLGS